MFKRTVLKLSENSNRNSNLPPSVQEIISLPLTKKIKNHFKSNEDLMKSQAMPFELTGEYLPRKPINPYRRRPLKVTYDQSHYQGFVLPSRRKYAYGLFDQEELFGIKRFRNDSPFIKEYIKIDNQILTLLMLFAVLSIFYFSNRDYETKELRREIIASEYGIFSADDLV